MSRDHSHKSMSLPRVSSLHASYHEAHTSSSGENLDEADTVSHSTKESKRKKYNPFRAVRRIFRWGSKGRRFKCAQDQSDNIGPSKKSLSTGELRQVALEPMEDDTIDVNDPTVISVGQGVALGRDMMSQNAALYSMGLSLSHDSVFSPDTSTPAEMGQIIHPVPIMTGVSIANSLFKNELFNRVRARRADEDSEDEDHGLPRSPCPATPTTVDVLHSPGNKVKSRSTCSAGSLSSMLSSETDEDSLSAGVTNSQNQLIGRNGQLSHKAALHKIAIKPQKNHTRRRPLRQGTSTEPSLPATPEEKLHQDESSEKTNEDEDISQEQDMEMSASTSGSTSRPLSAEDLDYNSSSKASPTPETLAAVTPEVSLRRTSLETMASDPLRARAVSAYMPVAEEREERRRSQAAIAMQVEETPLPEPVASQVDEELKRKSRKPIGGVAMMNVMTIQEAVGKSNSGMGLGLGSGGTGPNLVNVQRSRSMRHETSTCADEFVAEFRVSKHATNSAGNEGVDGGAIHPPGISPSSDRDKLDSQSRKCSDNRENVCDVEKNSSSSAQNSPVKKNLNVSSEFFQRSKSFSAKVSETHQTLEGNNSKELNNPSPNRRSIIPTSTTGCPDTSSQELVVDVRESIRSLERRKQTSPVLVSSDEPAGSSAPMGALSSPASASNNIPISQNSSQPLTGSRSPTVAKGVTNSIPTPNDPKANSTDLNYPIHFRVYKGARRRPEEDGSRKEPIKTSAKASNIITNQSVASASGVAERPASMVDPSTPFDSCVELRKKPFDNSSVSSVSTPKGTSSTQQHAFTHTTSEKSSEAEKSTIAGEPELFKVFARRSLKQKPVPQTEKQQPKNGDSQPKEQKPIDEPASKVVVKPDKKDTRVGLQSPGGQSIVPGAASQAQHTESPAGAKILRNEASRKEATVLPQLKQVSKVKPTSVLPSKNPEKSDVVIIPESGPVSLPAFRRDSDVKKQEKAPQDSNHGPKSLYVPADAKSDKKVSAVLQRASSMSSGTSIKAIPIVKETKEVLEESGQDSSNQPEWLVLAQKKREQRELKEKMAVGVATKENTKNETPNNQTEIEDDTAATTLRQSKVLDLVSNFQKLQMA